MDIFESTLKKKVYPAKPKEKPAGPPEPSPIYVFGVNMPENKPKKKEVDEEEESTEPDYELLREENPYKIPYTHEVKIKAHGKAVTALGLDPAGARLITGGYDYQMKFWDFPAMDMRFRSFRQIEPTGNYWLHTLQYSVSGDKILVASNSPQAKIYDRDGFQLTEFVKGYQYIADVTHTKGHISNITCGQWHPNDTSVVVTSSQDSSIRFWDINNEKQHKHILKIKNKQGLSRGITPTAFIISHDGRILLAACNDGSIQKWSAEGPFNRALARLDDAHVPQTDISSIQIARDNVTFATRGVDNTLKLWDLRKFKEPLKSFTQLPNKYPETDIVFSPDEGLLVTGTSVSKHDAVGCLVFLDKQKMEIVKKIAISPASVVSILWHPQLNQIICGCSDGSIKILFDPEWSKKGVLYALSKAPRAPRPEDFNHILPGAIQNPHALAQYKAPPSAKRQKEKARKDPKLSKKPEEPQKGVGTAGRLGMSLTAYMMKGLVKKDNFGEDPRAELLKYAEVAKSDPYFFRVYADNPTVFSNEPPEEEEEEETEQPKQPTNNTNTNTNTNK